MKLNLRQMLKLTVFLIIGLVTTQTAIAQIDPDFGTNGSVATDVFGNDQTLNSFVLPNDKILIAGSGTSGTQTRYYLVRYNSDGTLDSSYGANGIVNLNVPAVANALFLRAARQTDGKIVLTGSTGANSLIVRFNEDGTLDNGFAGTGYQIPNFNPNGNDKVDAAGIQPDGKIVIASYFSAGFSGRHFYLVRYLPDGSLDPSFGNGGLVNYINLLFDYTLPRNILFQSNGKLIVNLSDGNLLRFNADSSRDASFTFTLPADINLSERSLVVQPDDKIVIAGRSARTDNLERLNDDITVVRYNADGSSDSSFGNGGRSDIDLTSYFNDFPGVVRLDANGQIFISGSTYIQPNRSQTRGYQLSLIRLSANGQVNGKFLVNGNTGAGLVNVLNSGKILLAGSTASSNDSDIYLLRAVGVPLRTYYFKGTPFDFNYISYISQFAATADFAVFRASNLNWYYDQSVGTGTSFGDVNDIRAASDYIGDFRTELAVFRPSNGTWYIGRYSFNPAQNFIAVQWGQAGDIPVPADYDGDGKSDIAVFRPSNGYWYIRNGSNNSLSAYQFGAGEDKPVPGDYDGDGKADIAVFRPSNGTWYLLKSSAGFSAAQFGASEDIPVQEDYDGDGKADIAVRRPSNGFWYRINSIDNSFSAVSWGFTTDKPVPADYDGDSKTDIAVWRPSNAQWYVLKSSTNSLGAYNWGTISDLPVQERK